MLTLISLTDLDPIPETTLILVPINLEHESPILDSHITLMGNECELQFFDLDEPKWTLNPRLTLSHILKTVLILVSSILEPRSAILPIHSPLLDLGIDHYDSEMIFQDWSYNGDDFMLGSCMIITK